MVRCVQHDSGRLTPGPAVVSQAVLAMDLAALAAHGGTVGPTWRPAGEARRVYWEQRKGPPCGATGRAGAGLHHSLLNREKYPVAGGGPLWSCLRCSLPNLPF